MSQNHNAIVTTGWSNPKTAELYVLRWPVEPELRSQCENGNQCGGCSFFAPFNADWGLCVRAESRHHLETVFEHFTCPSYVNEGWGPHSFSSDTDFHCRCGGEGSEYWDRIAALFAENRKAIAPEADRTETTP